MNPWGQSCQATNQSLRAAVDAVGDLVTCYQRDIDGKTRISPKTAYQIDNSLAELSDALQKLTVSVSGVADAHSRASLAFLAGKELDREQFYILLATECIDWTNKNLGLSDFDDFELFDLLRYEADGKSGYIYLASDIDDVPDLDPDDWALRLLSRSYRSAIIAPEAIQWSSLSREQRLFFRNYLPGTVERFIHEQPTTRHRQAPAKDSAKQATPLSGNMTRVDLQEFIAALRSLKAHQKARRKMDLLIRRSNRKGKLILELSGRSKYAGFLTTINCDGRWKTNTLAPAASFRGFIAHPPAGDTARMSFHDGRLCIGAWSCPARAAAVD